MLGFVFGWRKASKCKKLVKRALCRLKMLRKKRYSIVRQLREDLVELINNGYRKIAFDRVEQLTRDESLIEAYDLIENFCEFILVNFSYIRKHKSCSDDIMEAISSLVFASARCVDFPELKLVRKLFGERYGQSFAMAAVELSLGNLVNPQIKEKLIMKAVSDDEKQRLINEIARDCFHPAVLALEYCPDWHQKQVLENGDQTYCEREEEEETEIQDGGGGDMVDPQSHSTSSTCLASQSSPTSPDIKVPSEREEVCNNPALASPVCNNNGGIAGSSLEDGLDGDEENDASSPEFPSLSEETIVYLDDIVELPNPSTEDGDLWDQRFFKFTSPATSMRENVQDDNNTKSRSCTSTNGSHKRSRCPEKNRSSHTKKKPAKNCCLGQPCYVCSDCKTDDSEVWISENKKVDSYLIRIGDSNEVGNVVYDVFIYSRCQPDEDEEDHGKPEEDNSTKYMKAAASTLQPSQHSQKEKTPCPEKYPRHVHPKLPDCDEIAAKFSALKREYLQRNQQQQNQSRN